MWSAEPYRPAGQGQPRTKSSPAPFQHLVPCTKQGQGTPRMGNDCVASHRAGGKGSWFNPIPTTELGLWESSGMKYQCLKDLPLSDVDTSSCSANPSWSRRILKHQVLPAERPWWLYKHCCRIHPGSPGMITKSWEEKQPNSSVEATAATQTIQPVHWQESNQRDEQGISQDTGQQNEHQGGWMQC